MMTETSSPIRVGVFDSMEETEAVVRELREAGFTAKEISVVCSDESKAERFSEYVHEKPAGAYTNAALTGAGAAGLGLGAAALLTAMVTSAGTAVFVVGAFAGLAAVGTFAAMMVTRGAEKELADYYDQAVMHGKLLVAVETRNPQRQHLADQILARHNPEQPGALPTED